MTIPSIKGEEVKAVAGKGRRFIYTNRRHSEKAIMGMVLGVISLGAIVLSVVLSYNKAGEIPMKFGLSVLLAVIFALIGEVLGIVTVMEKERFLLFPVVALVLNSLAILGAGILVYLGSYI